MTEVPGDDPVRDCTCFGCGVPLFRYNEVGRVVTNVPFAVVVLTRRMPATTEWRKIVVEGKVVDVVEFPSACSRQCFYEVVAKCDAYAYDPPLDAPVFEYDQELVRVMWGEWPGIDTGTLPLMPERST